LGGVLGLQKKFHNKGTLCEHIDPKDTRILLVEIKAIIIMGGVLGAVGTRGMGSGEARFFRVDLLSAGKRPAFDPTHFIGLYLNVMNHSLLLVFTESV